MKGIKEKLRQHTEIKKFQQGENREKKAGLLKENKRRKTLQSLVKA